MEHTAEADALCTSPFMGEAGRGPSRSEFVSLPLAGRVAALGRKAAVAELGWGYRTARTPARTPA